MMITPLKTEAVTARYDDDLRLVIVTYRHVLSPDVTASVYRWLGELIARIPVENARGSIYDFRSVTDFQLGNLSTAQTRSRNLNINVDLSKHAVALLVAGMYQEQMVRVSMRVTPQETRKRIVKSEDEALAFINAFNERHGLTFDIDAARLSQWPEVPPAATSE